MRKVSILCIIFQLKSRLGAGGCGLVVDLQQLRRCFGRSGSATQHHQARALGCRSRNPAAVVGPLLGQGVGGDPGASNKCDAVSAGVSKIPATCN